MSSSFANCKIARRIGVRKRLNRLSRLQKYMTSDIYTILDDLGISYEKHEHEAVFTVEEANKHYAVISGAHTKNLFLKNKTASQFYLFSIASHKRADLKALAKTLGESKLHFGNERELMEYLGLTPGSVSLLGLANDREGRVKVLIDRELWEAERINSHPNTNTATLTLSQVDFRRFLEWSGHGVKVVNCP
ncbi:MAG: prolyl-tRNA synthetase associated domain-containing protein [bacterium]|nr:prolyl-tRNA synthetase associated domain-containing protein [bacterium]